MQVDPIYTLEDYVKSMRIVFEDALKKGMVAVKINAAYKRSLYFEKVPVETARKVFRTLINGNEDLVLPAKDAKPLQDYMMFQLLDLARKYNSTGRDSYRHPGRWNKYSWRTQILHC